MRQPCEYWLKCLIATGAADDEQLRLLTRSAGFPEIEAAYIALLRAEITSSRPPQFVLRSTAGRKYLRGIKVISLATEAPDATAARDILCNARLRPVLEALIVSGMSLEEVVSSVETILGASVPIGVVRLYRHYFCNYSKMTPADCNAFFAGYRVSFGSKLRTFYNRGPEFARWKLGDTSLTVTVDKMVDNVLRESSMRFMELSTQPNSRDVALAAKMWTEQAMKAAEFKKASGSAVKEAETALVKVSLQLGRREISSIDTIETEEKK